MNIAGLQVRNTKDLIDENTRFCGLIYARAKFGKTSTLATFDQMTKRFYGKPTLIIAVEAGEGGGTMSIRECGVDYIIPGSYDEFKRIVAGLQADTVYGGVGLDSSSELVNRFLKPYALKFSSREHTDRRVAGVPERSDYHTMGEEARTQFNQLVNLTVHPDLNIRKHLLVTALYKEQYSPDGKTLTKIYPDLPGAMADTATAMFQTVGIIEIRPRVVPDPKDPKKTIRLNERVLITEAEGVKVVGDRTKMLPCPAPLDMVEIWEKYWLPKLEEIRKGREAK